HRQPEVDQAEGERSSHDGWRHRRHFWGWRRGGQTGRDAPRRRQLPMPRPVAYLIVFVASACTLILELVAGRILAPYIGVSLYTWTSIIGVCLAGISLGNYLGGRNAHR